MIEPRDELGGVRAKGDCGKEGGGVDFPRPEARRAIASVDHAFGNGVQNFEWADEGSGLENFELEIAAADGAELFSDMRYLLPDHIDRHGDEGGEFDARFVGRGSRFAGWVGRGASAAREQRSGKDY